MLSFLDMQDCGEPEEALFEGVPELRQRGITRGEPRPLESEQLE